MPSPEGTVQRLVAGFATAGFEGGRLASLQAFHEPRLEELAAGRRQPLRVLSGKRLTASLDAAGRVTTMVGDEEVRYRDERLRAEGDHARFDVPAGKGELTGDPVRAVTERGEVFAPRVTYDRNTGFVESHGGVRALIRRAGEMGFRGTPFAAGQGPVRVEAEEGLMREEPRGVLFRGHVRAWQGKNLLIADTLRGDDDADGQRLSATGSVRTVWVPEPAATEAEGDAPPAPVEVTSRSLRYREAADELVYEGAVRAEQLERELACRRLVVELTPEGEAERMVCTGNARLDDRELGNAARGETAVYDLAARTVTMTGDPVVLRRGDGGVVQGREVVYTIDTGKVVVGKERADAAPAAADPLPASTPTEVGPEAAEPPSAAAEGGG
jgi:lipopolysaccharide transport protein LptA